MRLTDVGFSWPNELPAAARWHARPATRRFACRWIVVPRLHLLRDLAFRQQLARCQPYLDHLAGAGADAADRLAVARIAVRHGDTTLVAAAYLDLSGIHHRIDEARSGNQHLVADGHEVDRSPQAPPAPGPVAHLARGRAVLGKRAQDVHRAVDPESGPAVDGVGHYCYREIVLGDHAGARDVALQAAGMTEPIPAVQCAADGAKAVVTLEARVLIAPLPADHLAPAGDGKHACAGLRRELAEEQRQIAGRAHDPAGRSDRVGREAARDHHAPAEDQLAAMAARHRRGPRYRHVGMCFI